MDTTIVTVEDEEETTQPASPLLNDFADDPNHPQRWVHRRRMAYIALFSIIFVMAYCLTPFMTTEKMTMVNEIIYWFYFSMTTIVSAYMGLATFSAVWNKK